jgi:hypothetical protein
MSNTTARARANARALGDVPTQLAALEQLSVGQLAAKYRDLYGEPTRTRNKDYLRKRLSWRIQELLEGGLPASALERIAQLGDDLPERWRMRQDAQTKEIGPVQPTEPRDPRVPPVGTVLHRAFNGVAHDVTVCCEGFDYAGERFKTLSAVAKHITGTPWNGFLFFGLKKRVETTSEESAA